MARSRKASRGEKIAPPSTNWRTRLPWIALLLGIALRIAFHEASEQTPDERYYTTYAKQLLTYGPSFFPGFVHAVNQHPQPGLFPWPQRCGYVMIGAAAMVLTGHRTVDTVGGIL